MKCSCGLSAIYGVLGEQAQRCTRHALPGDVRRPRQRCCTKGCQSIGVFVGNGRWCQDHKSPDQICLLDVCKCGYRVEESGKCVLCRPMGGRVGRNPGARAAYDAMRKLGVDMSVDLCVSARCRYRPDFLLKLPTGYIAVEVDEYAHSYIDDATEGRRMRAVARELGNITFIRWNPNADIDLASSVRHLESVVQHARPWGMTVIYLFYRID